MTELLEGYVLATSNLPTAAFHGGDFVGGDWGDGNAVEVETVRLPDKLRADSVLLLGRPGDLVDHHLKKPC